MTKHAHSNTLIIVDLVARLDIAAAEPFCDIDSLEESLDTRSQLQYSEEAGARLKRLAINEWICSDTDVGVYAYFFDDKFVAISQQPGRRADVTWKWLSQEAMYQVRDFIRSIEEYVCLRNVEILKDGEALESYWLEEGPYNDERYRDVNFKF